MPQTFFKTQAQLTKLIEGYFAHIQGEDAEPEQTLNDKKSTTIAAQKEYTRQPEPPTFTGLMLFLGFSSRAQFDACCAKGKFAILLSQARLRIEASYEKKLHGSLANGAMFALKNAGWNDKPEPPAKKQKEFKSLKVDMFQTGQSLAALEKEVTL